MFLFVCFFFFFKQETAYELRISDWSSDVCSSDLAYLPIYGDSMYPRFVNGEIIAVKEIANRDVILWGEAYLVVTDERANGMITVKLLHQHEDADKIIQIGRASCRERVCQYV